MTRYAVEKKHSEIKAILCGLKIEHPALVQRRKELIREVSSAEDADSRSEEEIRKSFMEVHIHFMTICKRLGYFKPLAGLFR